MRTSTYSGGAVQFPNSEFQEGMKIKCVTSSGVNRMSSYYNILKDACSPTCLHQRSESNSQEAIFRLQLEIFVQTV